LHCGEQRPPAIGIYQQQTENAKPAGQLLEDLWYRPTSIVVHCSEVISTIYR